ncbi:hypothetical protein PSHT_03278 [Puccinia striiformis]|uniref:Uncharacterized protein n=1 Tax=Puccinia striiformis TaxID=27350 RepID=A0A2S4WFV8_9BASI|nr:hypothetical protein PSHT_03278 [Puccinia striiformis]
MHRVRYLVVACRIPPLEDPLWLSINHKPPSLDIYVWLVLVKMDALMADMKACTMADSGNSLSERIATVIKTLTLLALRYHPSRRHAELDHSPGMETEELSQRQLDQKIMLLGRLESRYLPSIKDDLRTLSTALDPPHLDPEEHPSFDIELTMETLTNVYQTIQVTSRFVRSVAIYTPVPMSTHDHHYKRCKAYRSKCLMSDVDGLEYKLSDVFADYVRLLNSWKLPIDHLEGPRYRRLAAREKTAICLRSIDQIISSSQGSDFALLQTMWEGMDPPLIRTLESLANLIDCHKENHSALRKQVVKLARSTVTLIKLQTTLYNKISNTTTNNMQFTMGTEINSKTLSLLHGYPNQILQQCDSYIRDLQESHDIGSMTMAKTKSLPPVIQALQALTEDTGKSFWTTNQTGADWGRTRPENQTIGRAAFKPSALNENQLETLSIALDKPHNDSQERRSPDIELTFDTLTKLDQTMQTTSNYIRRATSQTPVPLDTHDHRLERCKTFRCRCLKRDIDCLEQKIQRLFLAYIRMVESWNLASDHSEDPDDRLPTPREETAMYDQMVPSVRLRVPPKNVAVDVSSLISTLRPLSNLTTLDQESNSALRIQVVKMANLTLPLIKLLTIFYDKISNTTTQKLQFTMSTEINSQTLSHHRTNAIGILFWFMENTTEMRSSLEQDILTMIAIDSMPTVDSNVAFLDSRAVPSSLKIDHSSLQTDFKTWLFEWQGVWHMAKKNLLDSIHLPEEANQ